MARTGGNRLRTRDEARANAIPNEPGTMINLLRGVPGVFGSIPNSEVDGMCPAILYVTGAGYKCYFDPSEVPLTRPLAHHTLADDQGLEDDSIISAYLVDSSAGRTLFPNEGSLCDIGIPEHGSLDEKLRELSVEFVGRAAVEFGGVSSEGKSCGLVTIALATQTLLADAHSRGLDFMQTELDLRLVIDTVLA